MSVLVIERAGVIDAVSELDKLNVRVLEVETVNEGDFDFRTVFESVRDSDEVIDGVVVLLDRFA